MIFKPTAIRATLKGVLVSPEALKTPLKVSIWKKNGAHKKIMRRYFVPIAVTSRGVPIRLKNWGVRIIPIIAKRDEPMSAKRKACSETKEA